MGWLRPELWLPVPKGDLRKFGFRPNILLKLQLNGRWRDGPGPTALRRGLQTRLVRQLPPLPLVRRRQPRWLRVLDDVKCDMAGIGAQGVSVLEKGHASS